MFNLKTRNLTLSFLGPENVKYTDFVAEGWQRLKGKKTLVNKVFEAKDIEVYPETNVSIITLTSKFFERVT